MSLQSLNINQSINEPNIFNNKNKIVCNMHAYYFVEFMTNATLTVCNSRLFTVTLQEVTEHFFI